jgi:hypothetical protein
MTKEALDILKDLHSSGQTGLAVMIVALLVIVASVAWVAWAQRQVMKKFDLNIKTIEAQIKAADASIRAADSSRQESRAEQATAHKLVMDQFNTVLKTNKELRTEISRIEQKQEGLKDSIKNTITIGLEDIRQRLVAIKVTDLIEQIPDKFRNDLETELMSASERLTKSLIEKLRELPDDFLTKNQAAQDVIVQQVEKALTRVLRDKVDWFYPDSRVLDYMPKRIASELGEMYRFPLR